MPSTIASTSTTDTSSDYRPPKVWKFEKDTPGSVWSSTNFPTAGPRHEKRLPVGQHPFQLYSMGTPNGQKVTILLEELLEAGYTKAEYDAWLIKIDGDQFGSDFVKINPNSKIPALIDQSEKKEPVRVFESGSILMHLAEKFGAFFPAEKRTEVLNWLFWQVGSAPYVGGGFGHFYHFADVKQKYPIDRFTMETKRQLDVLNHQLAENDYVVGDEYTIADMAIFPWYGSLVFGEIYGDSATFLNAAEDYPHVIRWARQIAARPAVIRGCMVNKYWGDQGQLDERHSAADFDNAFDTLAQ